MQGTPARNGANPGDQINREQRHTYASIGNVTQPIVANQEESYERQRNGMDRIGGCPGAVEVSTELFSWVRLDDAWLHNPKVRRAGIFGRALYIAAICYAHRQDNDGDIDADVIDLLAVEAGMTVEQANDAADRLVEFGLFARTASGWHVHDYESAQDTRAERESTREGHRIRKARQRARLADVTRDSHGSHGDVTSGEERESREEEEHSRETRDSEPPSQTPSKDPFGAQFEEWWKLFPKKLAKGAAKANYVALRRRGICATDLTLAIERYARNRRGEDPQFTMQGSTFLAKERWSDWLPGGPAEREAKAHASPAAAAAARLAARGGQR